MKPLSSPESILISMALLGAISLFLYIYKLLICQPKLLRSQLHNQGIKGPPPSLLHGNTHQIQKIKANSITTNDQSQHIISHDYFSKIFPYFQLWMDQYGPTFMYSTGTIQHLYVSDPLMVKEICQNTSMDLGRPIYLQEEHGPLLGESIFATNGSLWSHQRKVIAPQFLMEKVKGMVGLMVDSAMVLVNSWENQIESEGGVGDISVGEDLRRFSSDVISKACFGSTYSKGEAIFQKLTSLQKLLSNQGLFVEHPYLRYFPTKKNRQLRKLEKEVGILILKMVKERKESKPKNDLLQMILEGAQNEEVKLHSVERFIIDNCKNIYFAGQENTATSASWILFLLATNQEWQTRVRDEVLEICGDSLPDFNMLRKMKLLTMVIQEALRLYPPAPFVAREVFQSTKFGDLYIPKGINIWFPVLVLHQDTEIWGPDASEFNPERFSRGIGKACKIHQVYLPFGTGTRTCAGQNFAMVELKIIISIILSKFCFTLSPTYKHSPVSSLVIEPKDGVGLVVKKL
ncbi:hypothetical protein ACHQM5_013228 [Ranunculus cassubicifolius]